MLVSGFWLRVPARSFVPWAALLLAACGTTQPAGVLLAGRVLRGAGTDGAISGLPFPGVQVVLRDSSGSRSATTDAAGRFSFPLPSGPFELHAVPPDLLAASALSFFGLHARRTGTDLTVYLPLNTAVGTDARDTGNTPQVAVRGVLVGPDGHPQPGSVPPDLFPGLPGTRGAVVWGFYGVPESPGRWLYSTAAREDGRFEVRGLLGGQAKARTHYLFAGNYDGGPTSARYFTAYSFQPALTAVAGAVTDLGTVALRPVDGDFTVSYSPDTAALARAHFEPGAVTYTFVAVDPGVLGDPIEVAELQSRPGGAGDGPSVTVPVPAIARPSMPYTVVSFLLRSGCAACARAGTVVLGSAAPWASVRYLAPPVGVALHGKTFRWRPPEGATLQFVYALDARTLLAVWGGYLPAGASEAELPLSLPAGTYLVRVYAEDFLRPEDLLAGQVATSVPATVPVRRSLHPVRAGRPRVQASAPLVVRASVSEEVRVSP